MSKVREKLTTHEFEIIETRTYRVLGDGRSELEASQDAIERFHRLSKSGELVADRISRPRVNKRLKP